MKKFLSLAMILGAGVIAVPSIEAKSAATAPTMSDPQIRVQIGRNRRYRHRRTFVTTRIRRVGSWRYRETIRTTYMPNGTTRTVIIRRQRLGRW